MAQPVLALWFLHPVFLSDVLSDVIGVISKYSADSGLSNGGWPKQFCPGLLHENLGRFFMIHTVLLFC